MNKNRNYSKNRDRKDYRDKKRSKNRPAYDPEAKALKEQEEKQDYNNKPSWYYHDKVLMDQAASFSLNQFLQEDGKPFTGNFENIEVPPIMTLLFNPCPGYTRGESVMDGGLNKAALSLYTRLSSMNAKTTNYQPQDIAMLLLALGEVISLSEHIRRFFRSVFIYNKRNWAYPKALVEAMGFKYIEGGTKILANLRMRFNSILNGINKISFPGDISYFEKCAAMYSHIYVDSESPMAQTYLFVPATTWMIDEESSTEGTMLKTTPVCLEGNNLAIHEVDWYLDLLENMIRTITTTSVFNYIYADILRLVNPGRLLTLPYLTEAETISPEYDPMILVQIDNLTMINNPTSSAVSESHTSSNDVMQKVDNNAVFYAPIIPVPNGLGALERTIINFPHSMGNPDVDQKVESTRMITLFEGTAEGTERAAMPDHYCIGAKITCPINGMADVIYTPFRWKRAQVGGNNILPLTWSLTKFSHHPRIYVKNDEDENKYDAVFGDLDFFTDIDIDYLLAVNDLAYNDLFNVEL